MNHFAQFDPHVVRERNAELRREARSLHLEKRLRQDGASPFGRRLLALFSWDSLPLPRGAAHKA